MELLLRRMTKKKTCSSTTSTSTSSLTSNNNKTATSTPKAKPQASHQAKQTKKFKRLLMTGLVSEAAYHELDGSSTERDEVSSDFLVSRHYQDGHELVDEEEEDDSTCDSLELPDGQVRIGWGSMSITFDKPEVVISPLLDQSMFDDYAAMASSGPGVRHFSAPAAHSSLPIASASESTEKAKESMSTLGKSQTPQGIVSFHKLSRDFTGTGSKHAKTPPIAAKHRTGVLDAEHHDQSDGEREGEVVVVMSDGEGSSTPHPLMTLPLIRDDVAAVAGLERMGTQEREHAREEKEEAESLIPSVETLEVEEEEEEEGEDSEEEVENLDNWEYEVDPDNPHALMKRTRAITFVWKSGHEKSTSLVRQLSNNTYADQLRQSRAYRTELATVKSGRDMETVHESSMTYRDEGGDGSGGGFFSSLCCCCSSSSSSSSSSSASFSPSRKRATSVSLLESTSTMRRRSSLKMTRSQTLSQNKDSTELLSSWSAVY